MGKRSLWIQVSIFLAFIGLFFVINLIKPDKEFSDQENRYLQQRPKFTFSDLASGKFTSNYEKYITDQFALRDEWIALKAGSELAVVKHRNNGVYLCADDTLIEPFDAPDASVLDANMAAVNALKSNLDVPVYFALIPDKAQLNASLLPSGAPNDSESDTIDYCYDLSGAVNVDMFSPLSAHASDGIFYRTDHHWTSLGAYWGYAAIMDAMGMTPRSLGSYSPTTVSDSFFGTTYSSSGFSWVKPDTIETYVDAPEGLKIVNYPQGSPVDGALYDESFLAKKDKYSYFMGGNSPLQQITTGVEDAPSLLIIRDSYTDSLIPFLLEDFSEIHVLDLRYYRAGVAAYVAENSIDNVLVLYSVKNFCTDSNIFLLGR